MPKHNSYSGAEATFRRFHSRDPNKGVFPFTKSESGSIYLPEYVDWPEKVKPLGRAARTLYESDKWNKIGKTVEYYHDHGPGVTFYVPSKRGTDFPPGYPPEIALIGEAIGFVIEDFNRDLQEGIMKGKNILVASPDGWVDPEKPNRVFLAIINLDGGGIEALIDGGKLRITAHGIEG